MAYREFIETKAFTTTWTELELTDDDLRALQNQLLDNPQAGPVIRHTNGARKIRIPFEGKGKSGSGRVIYVDIEIRNRIHLITAYRRISRKP